MTRLVSPLLFSALIAVIAFADDTPVFRSDVSLVRVDVQVVDSANRAITGLQVQDFRLYSNGKPVEIKNFSAEEMPVDVLLLLDVSGSMQPHIQRLNEASHQALAVLGETDRVGIMVFDRQTRVRLPFSSDRNRVERGLQEVMNEGFNGGTDITQALHEAANYIARNGRRDARRAIVILTDDETERERDDVGVGMALDRADAVLSALIAPDAMHTRGGYGRGYPRGGGGGGYPGGGYPSGGGMGGPLGGIILGRRYPGGGGGGWPGGGGGNWPSGGGGNGPVIMSGGRTHSAGTSEIARNSGGDSMSIDDAGAFENTLARLRQRYTLHYNLPEGTDNTRERIDVQLADNARRRYAGSEVRYRRVSASSDGTRADPVTISRTPNRGRDTSPSPVYDDPAPGLHKRRAPVNEDGTPIDNGGGWKRTDPAQQQPAPQARPAPQQPQHQEQQPQQGGWRRVKPGEQP